MIEDMKAGKHAWRSWQNLLFLNIFLNFFKPLSRLAICSLNLIISNILLPLFHIYVFGYFRRRLCPNHVICLKVAVRIEVFYHLVLFPGYLVGGVVIFIIVLLVLIYSFCFFIYFVIKVFAPKVTWVLIFTIL